MVLNARLQEEQAVSNAVMNGRNSNMERFKPGVDGMVLLFSDNNGEVVYQFPYYEYFKAELEPLLHEVNSPSVMLLLCYFWNIQKH